MLRIASHQFEDYLRPSMRVSRTSQLLLAMNLRSLSALHSKECLVEALGGIDRSRKEQESGY